MKKKEDLVTLALTSMLEHDVMAYDLHYIEKRVRKMMDDMFEPLSFKDTGIATLRRDLFKEKLEEAKKTEIEPEKDEKPENQERNDRCEPICKKIVFKIMNQDFPEWYFEEAFENDEELLMENRLRDYINVLFDGLMFSVNESLMRANRKLWGAEKEDISMRRLDNILKS
jgi:hypothetical protein